MTARTFALTLACAASLGAQQSQADIRIEKTLAAGRTVSAHNLNGNVTVSPSTSGKVEIVGIKKGNSRYFADVSLEVVETSDGLMICPMFRDVDMECDERGFRVHDNGRRWGRGRDFDDLEIEIQVKVPRNLRVEAHSVSGDVRVTGAEGPVRGGSVSGNVRMEQLRATSIRASSVSGDVMVQVDELTGDGDLKFSSVSGNVTAELPKGIDADVTMRSVSGQLDSDFPLTLSGRMSRRSLEARIGKGGRNLDVTTVSGDVRLRQATK